MTIYDYKKQSGKSFGQIAEEIGLEKEPGRAIVCKICKEPQLHSKDRFLAVARSVGMPIASANKQYLRAKLDHEERRHLKNKKKLQGEIGRV